MFIFLFIIPLVLSLSSCSVAGNPEVNASFGSSHSSTQSTSAASFSTPSINSTFKVGDVIELTKETNVRSSGLVSSTSLLGQQVAGTIGTLKEGPSQTNDDYGLITWWKVDFQNGVDGFAGEDNFKIYIAPSDLGDKSSESSCVGASCATPPTVPTEPVPESSGCVNHLGHSITQYGITWTFDKAYPCGTFANGDFWIVGPLKINSVSPLPSSGRNGSMINPSNAYAQAFDSRAKLYSEGHRTSFPVNITSPSSVVSTVSRGDTCSNTTVCAHAYLQSAAVLTVLLQKPTNEGSTVFRPPYSGTQKTLFSTLSIRSDLIPSVRSPNLNVPSLPETASRFKKPYIDFISDWIGRYIHPIDNMNDYGAEIALDTNNAALRLMLNDSLIEKMPALINYLQYGIDLYGNLQIETQYYANGGHMLGRLLPLTFAATLLQSNEIKSAILKKGLENFQEDGSVVISKVNGTALFGQPRTGGESDYWQNQMIDRNSRTAPDPYGYIDGGLKPGGWYQYTSNGPTYKGTALALHLMPKLREIWPAEKFIAYVNRWVTDGAIAAPDPCAPATVYATYLNSSLAAHVTLYNSIMNDPNLTVSQKSNRIWEKRLEFGYGTLFGPNGSGGCIRGGGRHIGAHRTAVDGGTYRSKFVDALWPLHK